MIAPISSTSSHQKTSAGIALLTWLLVVFFLLSDLFLINGNIQSTTNYNLAYTLVNLPTTTPYPSSISTATPTPAAPAVTYSVTGNRIVDSTGKTFIPYGVQVVGLDNGGWQGSYGIQYLNKAQILSAHTDWNSNTISLPVASINLLDKSPYDPAYLAFIDKVVGWAHEEGMNTLLVLNYQHTSGLSIPNQDTLAFWNIISKHYVNSPWVFFDIFNEPYINPSFGTTPAAWNQWQNGYGGNQSMGMQQVVTAIRNNGSQNLIFADGILNASTLNGLTPLSGSNIIYSVHPYLAASGYTSSADWDTAFGNIGKQYPVVADQWNEYQSSSNKECFSGAPQVVPNLLHYLLIHNMGLIGYALEPGLLIRGWSYQSPTDFDLPNYICANISTPNMNPQAQGAGKQIMQFLQEHNTYSSGT